jgi:hypothetical protein
MENPLSNQGLTGPHCQMNALVACAGSKIFPPAITIKVDACDTSNNRDSAGIYETNSYENIISFRQAKGIKR